MDGIKSLFNSVFGVLRDLSGGDNWTYGQAAFLAFYILLGTFLVYMTAKHCIKDIYDCLTSVYSPVPVQEETVEEEEEGRGRGGG